MCSKYLKLDVQNVLISDECLAALDGRHGWSMIWVLEGSLCPHLSPNISLNGGDVIIRACIIGDELVDRVHVSDGIKLTDVVNVDFLKKNVHIFLNEKPQATLQKKDLLHTPQCALSYLKVSW